MKYQALGKSRGSSRRRSDGWWCGPVAARDACCAKSLKRWLTSGRANRVCLFERERLFEDVSFPRSRAPFAGQRPRFNEILFERRRAYRLAPSR